VTVELAAVFSGKGGAEHQVVSNTKQKRTGEFNHPKTSFPVLAKRYVANRDRTSDLKIFSLTLSQLSYSNFLHTVTRCWARSPFCRNNRVLPSVTICTRRTAKYTVAVEGFDPPTLGLWAQYASSAPNRWTIYKKR
jgi:hypothetical protein